MRNQIAKVTCVGNVVTWTFEGHGDVSIDLADVSEEMVTQAAIHGLKQKGSDCYAGASKAGPAAGMTPRAWAYEQCADVIGSILEGHWNKVREGGGAMQISDLVAALAELRPDADEATWKLRVEGMPKETIDDVKKVPEVNAIIQRLRAERAAKRAEQVEKAAADANTDLDSLLTF